MNFSNTSKGNNTEIDKISQMISYFSLIIISTGLVFNTITFLIFRINKSMKKIPSMVILSFICVTDTLGVGHYIEKYCISKKYRKDKLIECIIMSNIIMSNK